MLFLVKLNPEYSSSLLGQRNLCTVFSFVSYEEKGCYRIVSLGHQNSDCRSYCGLSRSMQGFVFPSPVKRLQIIWQRTSPFPNVCYLVCLETWITKRSMQGRRRQKCMDRNPMRYSRNYIRYHASSAGLSTVNGELVKVSQAVIGTRIRRERISFHRDRHVTNASNRVTPDLVRDCQQKITWPAGAPGWVTVEEMIDSRTVSDHKTGTNCCCHFKTFQRVVSLDPLILPPTKNHGIEVKLLRKISERLFRKKTYLFQVGSALNSRM